MDNQQPSTKTLFYYHPAKGNGIIYKYTSPSGKSYIGQTVNTLAKRADNILTGSGYKKCSVFWEGIKKYGWSNFSVEILEEVPFDLLNERESFYIKQYNSLTPNGYNICVGGEGGKRTNVYVYSAQNGNFLEHYNSEQEASIFTGVDNTTISAILHKRKLTAHNLIFSDTYLEKIDLSTIRVGNNKKIYVYDKDGYFLNEYVSARAAAKDLDISEISISKCVNGDRIHTKYLQFRRDKYDKIEPIPKNSKTPIAVNQYDLITKQLINTYPSYAAAARAVGLSSGAGIKKVVENHKGSSGGYFWTLSEGSTTTGSEIP